MGLVDCCVYMWRSFYFIKGDPTPVDYRLLLSTCHGIDAFLRYRTVHDGSRDWLGGVFVLRGERTYADDIEHFFTGFQVGELHDDDIDETFSPGGGPFYCGLMVGSAVRTQNVHPFECVKENLDESLKRTEETDPDCLDEGEDEVDVESQFESQSQQAQRLLEQRLTF